MTTLTLDSPRRSAGQQKLAEFEPEGFWPSYPNVLLVDDDPAVRESVRRVLSGQQLNVIVAASGAEAMRLIERHEPDLVITDLCMAGIDGWELIFQESQLRPDLPIFVTTALPANEACGADVFASAFFQKPLDFDALIAAIHRHLNPPQAETAVG